MRIDAHQHYWKIDRGDYGWIQPDNTVLYSDYLPPDLQMHLDEHRMDGTILVQAAPTFEETAYMLSLADRYHSIKGVVGYLAFGDARHSEYYEQFAKHPKFVGIRVNIPEMLDENQALSESYLEVLRGYAALGVSFDLLLNADQLDYLIELVERIPGLRGVIDHLAKPRIAEGQLEPWEEQMRVLASYPNLYCKLSGLVTEADHSDWKAEQFVPYVRHVIECFGQDRVMFGSDWPVCLMAASYREVVSALERALPETWGATEREKLYGGNAMSFYRIAK